MKTLRLLLRDELSRGVDALRDIDHARDIVFLAEVKKGTLTSLLGLLYLALKLQPRIKTCCIKSTKEAAQAVSWGASAIGLVSSMPSGPGVISESMIARIAASVPPPIATFLLTAERSASAIVAQQRRCRTNTLQLCDHLPAEIYPELRKQLPGIALVQVVHVVGPESVDYATSAARYVDALLLDSGNPKLKIKELGGTGRIHDWRLSRRIRDSISIPLFLAGGLHAANVDEAIATVQPFGLDLCSGVRTNDILDDVKLEALFAAVADEADKKLQGPHTSISGSEI